MGGCARHCGASLLGAEAETLSPRQATGSSPATQKMIRNYVAFLKVFAPLPLGIDGYARLCLVEVQSRRRNEARLL
jgi:hypothetical protein